MNTLVPISWKNSLDDLRSKILGTFDRWMPARTRDEGDEDHGFWPGALALNGGPAIDIEETDDEIQVTAEVPGLSEKDLRVELDGQRLMLRGEKKSSREEKRGAYSYSECSYGAFQRAIPLPCEVDADRVRATCKHGVLKLRLPKTESAKARRIHVQVN